MNGRCGICDEPATRTIGEYAFCERHFERANRGRRGGWQADVDPIALTHVASWASLVRRPRKALILAGLRRHLAVRAVFGGIGGILVVRAVRGLIRSRHLPRSGVDAEATVTRVEQTNVSSNRRLQFRVHYQYRDQQGGEHEGDSGYLEWEEASSWNEGDRVAVRYDPQRPAESQWIGKIEAPSPAFAGLRPADGRRRAATRLSVTRPDARRRMRTCEDRPSSRGSQPPP